MFIQGENALRTAVGAVRMNGKYGRDTRPVCNAERNMTGYGSKSREDVMTIPRRNGKSWMTAVKSLTEAVGEKKASEIIAEVEKKMESDIEKDDEVDIEDGRYNDIRTYE